jgi:hypothetical protein
MRREQAGERRACDTLSVMEFILDNYPQGTYLIDFDKTLTYNIPKPALIYYNENRSYIFSVIAKSRPGERLIDKKNIIGFDQSYIDLDSTELGTAFFYVVLFKCEEGNLRIIWEAPVPSHGGFNSISIERFLPGNTQYIKINFHYARGSGHINYNYFLLDGITSYPHLLMTYKGINFERRAAYINKDKFPDFYEYVFRDFNDIISPIDSVAFLWSEKDSLYINSRNKRQTRHY